MHEPRFSLEPGIDYDRTSLAPPGDPGDYMLTPAAFGSRAVSVGQRRGGNAGDDYLCERDSEAEAVAFIRRRTPDPVIWKRNDAGRWERYSAPHGGGPAPPGGGGVRGHRRLLRLVGRGTGGRRRTAADAVRPSERGDQRDRRHSAHGRSLLGPPADDATPGVVRVVGRPTGGRPGRIWRRSDRRLRAELYLPDVLLLGSLPRSRERARPHCRPTEDGSP